MSPAGSARSAVAAGRSARRLVVLASGNGSNLQALLDAGLPVVAVVANRRAAFALQRASQHGLATEYVPLKPFTDAGRSRRDYDRHLADVVERHRPDYIVLAGWMHVLSSAFLDRFSGRVVNLHPALPGAFPGAHAIEDALAAFADGRIDHTGVMVHLVPDEGIDDGPVLGTAEVPIVAGDTLESLSERAHAAEHPLLVATVTHLLDELDRFGAPG
jgi:formyltetrahydrofolate-dependent phosphoribosylglycinamide formyltransferase